MRHVRYNVASSLDGFIAGPNGEYDWIVQDPSIDFDALFAQFDTFVMGRKTFELTLTHGLGPMASKEVVVVSTTLRPADHPKVRIVSNDPAGAVRELKNRGGKDIWLFGGGVLFRTLLDAGVVDAVEVGLMPIMLGEGIPLLPSGRRSPALMLTSCNALPSGIVMLKYDVRTA